jgi:ABC-type amino acid transport substrate-binding protein
MVKLAKDATIRQFEYASDMYLALDQGKVEALATDINRARWLKKEQKQNLDILMPILFPEYISIGVKRGNEDLLNWVNLYLQELHESGRSAELYEKYLGEKPASWVIPWTNQSR